MFINGNPIPLQPLVNTSCPRNAGTQTYITTWLLAAVTTTLHINGNSDNFLGYVSAQCSTGQQLDGVQYSYHTDGRCPKLHTTDALLAPVQYITSKDGFTSISYMFVHDHPSSRHHDHLQLAQLLIRFATPAHHTPYDITVSLVVEIWLVVEISQSRWLWIHNQRSCA